MPHRRLTRNSLEDNIDISKYLTQDDVSGKDIDTSHAGEQQDLKLESEEDGDFVFIAAQQAVSNRKTSNLTGKLVKKGGGFQAMGLSTHLLKAIQRKGFSVPTPIQRKAIPLICDDQDVVGMARTGSGKTAAFVIPMIEKLKAHSAKVGARALILSPSRELALQTLKVFKELSRGTDLKCVLLVGGDSLEEQFAFIAANPDVLVATPGRFLHLKVEMSLDLSSMRHVVFDEADRLFEMGFAAQLTEILHALPSSRQTLLFSATLPKSLVEFARAGLHEPNLVRLDAESKISPDLQSAFFTVKSGEKEGALLHILHDIIKMPTGLAEVTEELTSTGKKRKRNAMELKAKLKSADHSTIIFAATKHHVEYLASILRLSGFAVSLAYGSLDQVARKCQVEKFRAGITNILVVTDVAARGIDIPVLANVINYDFPPQPKIFVHRVGRTARAGQRGWSYSLVRDTDAPYLLDLQLFLARRLITGGITAEKINYVEDVVIGACGRDKLENNMEWVSKLIVDNDDLAALRAVAAKAEHLYFKTRNSASNESAKRAKNIVASGAWVLLHPLFGTHSSNEEQARNEMLAQISGYRPHETVFEIGAKSKTGYRDAAELMRRRREKITPARLGEKNDRQSPLVKTLPGGDDQHNCDIEDEGEMDLTKTRGDGYSEASDKDLEITFSKSVQKRKGRTLSWKDSENFMSYAPKLFNAAEDRGYGVHSGSYNTASQNSNFLEAAKDITMNLTNDDARKSFAEGMRWDKKNSKYVWRRHDEDGSRGVKMIRGESGQKIAASFQSGRFDKWRKAHKVGRLPRTGEVEKESVLKGFAAGGFGRKYKHRQGKAPKEADKYRDDYYIQKKRVAEAKEKRIGRFRDGGGKEEVKSVADIRKKRSAIDSRKAKNARPLKKLRV